MVVIQDLGDERSSEKNERERLIAASRKPRRLLDLLLVRGHQHQQRDDAGGGSDKKRTSGDSDGAAASCTLAENMDLWCPDEEVVKEFLSPSPSSGDDGSLLALADALGQSADAVASACEELYVKTNLEGKGKVLITSCRDGWDSGGGGGGCNSRFFAENFPTEDVSEIESFCDAVHLLVTACAIVNRALLIRADGSEGDEGGGAAAGADRLVLALTVLPPAGKTMEEWFRTIRGGVGDARSCRYAAVDRLVGLLYAGAAALPKVGQAASTSLSLLVLRRPAACFATIMAPDRLVAGCVKRLEYVFYLTTKPKGTEKGRLKALWGTTTYLNMLPILYMMCHWKAVCPGLRTTLAGMVASLIVNFSNVLDLVEGGWEAIPDDDCRSFWGALYEQCGAGGSDDGDGNVVGNKRRIEFLSNNPAAFAIASTVEMMHYWASTGMSMKNCKILTRDGGDGSVAYFIGDSGKERIEALIERRRGGGGGDRGASSSDHCDVENFDLAYLRPLLDDLAQARDVPRRRSLDDSRLFSERSLLRGVFGAHQRCGLTTCRRRRRLSLSDGGGENSGDAGLLACTGGCGGLERYCCQEHQKQHWPVHKFFCKSNE